MEGPEGDWVKSMLGNVRSIAHLYWELECLWESLRILVNKIVPQKISIFCFTVWLSTSPEVTQSRRYFSFI